MYTFDAKKAAESCVQWIRDWFEENGKDCNAVVGISGGKDSTVVAALCARALGSERVVGVMMPDKTQADIQDSRDIIAHIGINGAECNIGEAVDAMLKCANAARELAYCLGFTAIPSRQARENLPPRERMALLYVIAQSANGRVSNNSNLSERWVGYGTIYGDLAGDFGPLQNFTVSEVIQIGKELGIPERFLVKAPSDGLCGKTDEDKLGFTYEALDKYIRTGQIEDKAVKERIDAMHRASEFKREIMAAFNAGVPAI